MLRTFLCLCMLVALTLAQIQCPVNTSFISTYTENHDMLRCVHLNHCLASCTGIWVQDYTTCMCVKMLPCSSPTMTRIMRPFDDTSQAVCV
jgi:hypothetical protein